jgi:hypothetical protein
MLRNIEVSPQLLHFQLTGVKLGNDVWKSIADILTTNQTLLKLSLHGMNLTLKNLDMLMPGLNLNTGLLSVDLSHNGFTDIYSGMLSKIITSGCERRD